MCERELRYEHDSGTQFPIHHVERNSELAVCSIIPWCDLALQGASADDVVSLDLEFAAEPSTVPLDLGIVHNRVADPSGHGSIWGDGNDHFLGVIGMFCWGTAQP